jgi:hypothetical protein
MVGSWNITIRLLAAAVAAVVSLVLAACGATAPDSELGTVPTMVTQSTAKVEQVIPTETVNVPAEPTAQPGPSSGHGEEEVSTMPKSTIEVAPLPGTVEPGMGPLIEMAREDLAGRLSISADEIEVLEAKAVVWPDASLGCPQPGMRYRQVPMDGALIRLLVEGKVYEYHSGGGRDPFLCEQPLKLQKDTVPQIDLLKLTPGSPNE